VQVDLVAVVVLVVAIMSQWCLTSEAQLNTVEAAALFDLCNATNVWASLGTNCSDSANACINTANWAGVNCNANKTAINGMYV